MIHWSILDKQRQEAVTRLGIAREQGFYLAGGTALALQFGHRDSIDFDFFRPEPFDTEALCGLLQQAFSGHDLVKVQDERNTLTAFVDDAIKLSFMTYPYPLLGQLVKADALDLAGPIDIGCMKLSAITGRAATKDYVDLYFILQRVPLPELLEHCGCKLPMLDQVLILKSLVFFEDLDEEPIRYTDEHRVEFDRIKNFLRSQVRSMQ